MAHHRGVVLDHQDRVADVAQAFQDFGQPSRVARVQADGGLIEDVERAHQIRAQRRSQLYALRLAARKRGGQPVEREVFEADFVQIFQPRADFLQQFVGHRHLKRRKVNLVEEVVRLLNRHPADVGDGLAVDAGVRSFGTQPSSPALGAEGVTAVAAEKDPHVQLVLLALEILEESPDAREVVVAFDHPTLLLGGQPVVRRIQGHAGRARQPFHLVREVAVARLGPGLDRTFSQRLAFIGDHQVKIKVDRVAESLAARAGPVWIVEGEQVRLGLGIRNLAPLALETLVEHEPLGTHGAPSSRFLS